MEPPIVPLGQIEEEEEDGEDQFDAENRKMGERVIVVDEGSFMVQNAESVDYVPYTLV